MAKEMKNPDSDRTILNVLLITTLLTAFLAILLLLVGASKGRSLFLSQNALLLVCVLVLPVLAAAFLFMAVRASHLGNESSRDAADRLARIESLLQGQGEDIRNVAQMSSLSDQAKSLIYHEREIDAFRETVQAMLLKQEYASADALVGRMESRLGLVEEAARMREEIAATRQATTDEKIKAALARIESILARQQWSQAKRESERLNSLFPQNAAVIALPKKIQDTWSAYKRQLLKDYGEAVRVNDVEQSIELLKELDRYLTPQEGAALAESARGVFKAKLHNLGVQFAIAVTDQQWSSAVATGEEITREYPNSRMSREVREKLDLLRAYATGAAQPPTPAPTQVRICQRRRLRLPGHVRFSSKTGCGSCSKDHRRVETPQTPQTPPQA